MRYSIQSLQMVYMYIYIFSSCRLHIYRSYFIFIHYAGSGASVTVVVTVNVTMAELTGLTLFSQYIFYVSSENAVSPQAMDTDNRSSITSASTLEGSELSLYPSYNNFITIKVLIEHLSKSVLNSLNSLKAFPTMRHHLRVVFLLCIAI